MDPEKRTIVSKPAPFGNNSPPPRIEQPIVPDIDTSQLNNGIIDPNPKHAWFCKIMGIPKDMENADYPSIWNIFKSDKRHQGLYQRVRRAYQWHTFQYWLVACMSNTLLLLQICFGAALTALGGTKSDRVSIAIIVLGALQTVAGGFLTYFKSRNQPNRARQFRITLRRVMDAIENSEAVLRDPTYKPPSYTPTANLTGTLYNAQDSWLSMGAVNPVQGLEVEGVLGMVLRCMDMYMDGVKEAESNYPDFWLTSKRDAQRTQLVVMRTVLDEMRKSGTGTRALAGEGDVTDAAGIGANAAEGAGQTSGINTARNESGNVSQSVTVSSGMGVATGPNNGHGLGTGLHGQQAV